jgi:hypothetical protein
MEGRDKMTKKPETIYDLATSWEQRCDRLHAVNAKLLEALESVIASSTAIAHAAPTALDGLPNARQLHLTDVASRDKARAAIEEARK